MDDLKLPSDFNNLFIRSINQYNFLGLYLFKERKTLFVRYSKLTINITLFVLCFLGQAIDAIVELESDGGYGQLIFMIGTTLLAIQDILKTIIMVIKQRKLQILITDIGKLWPEKDMSSIKKKEIYAKWLTRGKFFNIVFNINTKVSLVAFVMYPIVVSIDNIVTKKPNPYIYCMDLYLPWNTNSVVWFLILTLYTGYSATLLMAMYIASDILLASLTGSISLLLNLLQIDIQNWVTTTDRDNIISVEEENCKELNRIVIEHQKVLKLADQIQDIFGPIAFSEVLFTGIIICLYSFMTLIVKGSQKLICICYVWSNMAAVLNYAWPGQYIYEMSSGIGDAAYNCHWYQRGPKFRKSIHLLIIRAQRPCYISALGFSNLTFLTFSRILSSAWSYLTLLNQMFEE